jgi:hypothetical protein
LTNALNNLGVQLARLGALFASTNRLRQSADLGNARAAGNLAFTLTGQGFGKEAREWIERGLEVDANDTRVAAAAEALTTRTEQEGDLVQRIEERARALREAIKGFAASKSILPQGRWRISLWPNEVFEFVIDDRTAGATVGDGEKKVEVVISVGDDHLLVTASIGQYALRRAAGSATCDGVTLVGFLRDWPAAPGTTVFDGKPLQVPGPAQS